VIACYAYGDGLGHLTRVRAALHTLGLGGVPVTVLTGSSFAGDPRVTGGWTVLRAPAGDGLAGWIAAALADLAPDELVVDAFPAGLKGELTAKAVPSGTRVTHLARLLRWDAYRPLLPADPPHFDRSYVLEPLAPEHDAYLRSVSREITPLELVEPVETAAMSGPGAWLVVHSGPDAEILELVAYARELAAFEGRSPPLTLVSPRRPAALPAEIAHLDVYPVWPLFPSAERIITAAGFNAVRQLAPWRERHRMLPFPRTLDDQFTRAARTRRATPGTFRRS
jgi:hypothetical protein